MLVEKLITAEVVITAATMFREKWWAAHACCVPLTYRPELFHITSWEGAVGKRSPPWAWRMGCDLPRSRCAWSCETLRLTSQGALWQLSCLGVVDPRWIGSWTQERRGSLSSLAVSRPRPMHWLPLASACFLLGVVNLKNGIWGRRQCLTQVTTSRR